MTIYYIPRGWRRLVWWFLAYFRISRVAVCLMSRWGGPDYHNWPDSTPDSTLSTPWHFRYHRCVRCSKEFKI